MGSCGAGGDTSSTDIVPKLQLSSLPRLLMYKEKESVVSDLDAPRIRDAPSPREQSAQQGRVMGIMGPSSTDPGFPSGLCELWGQAGTGGASVLGRSARRHVPGRRPAPTPATPLALPQKNHAPQPRPSRPPRPSQPQALRSRRRGRWGPAPFVSGFDRRARSFTSAVAGGGAHARAVPSAGGGAHSNARIPALGCWAETSPHARPRLPRGLGAACALARGRRPESQTDAHALPPPRPQPARPHPLPLPLPRRRRPPSTRPRTRRPGHAPAKMAGAGAQLSVAAAAALPRS